MSDLFVAPIVLAAIGGLVVNVLSLLELQAVPKDRRPDFSDFFYWLPFLAWPLLGGLVGFLYYDAANPLGKFVSFQIGLSSPLILKAAATAIPSPAKVNLPPGA